MEILVLGSGQDGGAPQVGTATAVADPRTASSLALVDGGDVVLFDASCDLRHQWRLLGEARLRGVFLTHGHMGHYTGLVHLGREGAAVREVPLYGSPRMLTYLDTNEPWRSLLVAGHLRDRAVEEGDVVGPMDGVEVRATRVPHRAEFTDTFAWSLSIPGGTLLYMPDVDGWGGWDPLELIGAHDVALVDGTFWSEAEPPGRDITEVPHPTIRRSLDVLAPLIGSTRVVFTHLNHSNPAGAAGSPEEAEVLSRGFEIATDGMRIDLGAT